MWLEHWIYKLPLRVRSLFRRNRVDDELNDEMQFHLESHAEALVARGLSPEEARYAALRAMNGMEQQKEKCREARGVGLIEDLIADVTYALRSFRKTPALAALIIASLALGIGANTAIFSVINTVALKMLPVRDPRQLMLLGWSAPKWPQPFVENVEGNGGRDAEGLMSSYSFSSYAYSELVKQNHVFDNTMAFAANDEDVNIELNGRAESAHLQAVSGDFFNTLGVSPVLGRAILPGDDSDSAPAVAVVSQNFWRNYFPGDSGVSGKTIVINGASVSIVGVAPREFTGIVPGTAMDIFIPLGFYASEWKRLNPDEPLTEPKTWWMGILGRLKPGVTPEQARSELQVILDRTLKATATPTKDSVMPSIRLIPAGRGLNGLRGQFSTPLALLMGMVGLVLLIASANVAGLLIARATARQREIAVRMSLGASRSRIVRQLLTESVLLGSLGGLAGLLVSLWASSALVALLSGGRNHIDLPVHLDFRVLAFTAAISILSGIFFGLLPAISATRVNLAPTLKEGATQVSAGRRSLRAGKSLVAAQVALSLLLLIAAGLLLRTLNRLQQVNLGFDRKALLTFRLRPGLNGYKDARLTGYYEELQHRIQSLAGVRAVSFSQNGPIDAGYSANSPAIPGYTAPGTQAEVYRHIVGPGYFGALNIPIVLGRAVGAEDTKTSPKSLVVNETLVRKYFHGDNPIGKQLVYGRNGSMGAFTIVGVARDVKYGKVRDEAPPTAYWPYLQSSFAPAQMTFFVRTQGDPESIANALQQACREQDKNVPVVGMQTEEEVIDGSLFLERTFALLSSSFGALALLLACVGLYGTVAYAVARRTTEIGVRMALGAQRSRILWMILSEIFLVVAAGILIALPLAWATARLLNHQLYGLSPHDPFTFAGSTAAIIAITLLAGYLPARRASKIDPMISLRYE